MTSRSPNPRHRLGFSELAVGQSWTSPSRMVTESLIREFAAVSGDSNPLHLDLRTAERGPFRKPVAHGLLGLSIASGLCWNLPPVATLSLMEISSWSFHKPIFPDDSVKATNTVRELRPRKRGRGFVIWARELHNQHGELVQSGLVRVFLDKSRPPEVVPSLAN